jgi:hypothetical protein
MGHPNKPQHDLTYRLKHREDDHYRAKRRSYNVKNWQDPIMGPRLRQSVENWRKRNPEKIKAHDILNGEVRAGRVIRPRFCEKCGDTPEPARDGRSSIHAHHSDYSKPLDVKWLCASCHAIERRKYL